ncbi:MAG: hypothetical protein R6U64_05100, partial [Bacteroidales bacterium]
IGQNPTYFTRKFAAGERIWNILKTLCGRTLSFAPGISISKVVLFYPLIIRRTIPLNIDAFLLQSWVG